MEASQQRSRPALFAWAALAAYFAWRLFLLRVRYFDTDEFEHLHAALCIMHGSIPYRQFFELHPPLLWYGLAPLLSAFREPAQFLWIGRSVMFACVAGIFGLQSFLGGDGWTRFDRWISVFLLASFTTFAAKSLEIRPDIPAVLCLSAAFCLGVRTLSPRRAFALGILLSAAALFSLKAVFPAAGFLIGWRITARSIGRYGKRADLQTASVAVLGASILLACFVAYFGAHHALRDAYRCLYEFNKQFRGGFPTSQFLIPSLRENPALWILGLLGIFVPEWPAALRGALIVTLASLWVTRSSYEQSYLFVGPLLSISAAAAWRMIARRFRATAPHRIAILGISILLLAQPFILQLRASRQRNAQQLDILSCIAASTHTNDRILDLWTGLSFFRPHAIYFWFLPVDIQRALRSETLDPMIIRGLESPACRGLLWDPVYFEKLPENVHRAARALYSPSNCRDLWLRSERNHP